MWKMRPQKKLTKTPPSSSIVSPHSPPTVQKPDNVGFDVRGDVKIFDFGLAKELDESKKLDDGTYHLTADTGSLRYMAPGKLVVTRMHHFLLRHDDLLTSVVTSSRYFYRRSLFGQAV